MQALLALFVAFCPLPEPQCEVLVSLRYPENGETGFPRDGLVIVERDVRACAVVNTVVSYELTAEDGTRVPLNLVGKPEGSAPFAHDLLAPNTRYALTPTGGRSTTFTTGENMLDLPMIKDVSLELDTLDIEESECGDKARTVLTSELVVQFSGPSNDQFLLDVAFGPGGDIFPAARPLVVKTGSSIVGEAQLGSIDLWEGDTVCARVRTVRRTCLSCEVPVDERETCAPLPQSCATTRGGDLAIFLLVLPLVIGCRRRWL